MKSATCLDLTEVGVRILQSVQILSTHTLTIFHPEKWRLHIPPISTACRNPREPKTASLLNLLEFLFSASSHSHEYNGALAFRVRREEPDYLVVIKSQASSAQVLGVGRKIQL